MSRYYNGKDFDYNTFKRHIRSSNYKKELIEYANILQKNKELIKECILQRIQVKYECYKHESDFGHNYEILTKHKHEELIKLIRQKHTEIKKEELERRKEEERRRQEEQRREEEQRRIEE